MVFGLPFYDIFVTQKVPLSKISDDVIACDLWFGPSPITNPGYAYANVGGGAGGEELVPQFFSGGPRKI